MKEFDENSLVNDFDLLFGVKFCVKNIISCDAEPENVKYNENKYSVAMLKSSMAKEVNSGFSINKNTSHIKNKIIQ